MISVSVGFSAQGSWFGVNRALNHSLQYTGNMKWLDFFPPGPTLLKKNLSQEVTQSQVWQKKSGGERTKGGRELGQDSKG